MKTLWFLLFLLCTTALQAQSRYWITAEPCCATAVKERIKQEGGSILYCSRWFPAFEVSFATDNVNLMEWQGIASAEKLKRRTNKSQANKCDVETVLVETDESLPEGYWGYGETDIKTLHGHLLHNMGYRGEGIDIVVMDNGYWQVDSTFMNEGWVNREKIIPLYDAVNDDSTVYDSGTHGSYVLSVMATDSPGVFVGTAPDARYWLAITEDSDNEWRREEINWLQMAERVDSLRQIGEIGPRVIITTSLGYSTFDDASENYTYSDMDGNTALITMASDRAASKGMLVVNSAGNSGDDPWKYITAPADGDSVLAVGAVGPSLRPADFTSYGPSADGDVKPNVAAPGAEVVGLDPQGRLVYINGTSFSCPMVSGLAACLWQAFPERSAYEIFQAVEQSGHKWPAFDDRLGYGIPNFFNAYVALLDSVTLSAMDVLRTYPNPTTDGFTLVYRGRKEERITISIYNANGKRVWQRQADTEGGLLVREEIHTVHWQPAIYFIQLRTGDEVIQQKVIKR